jgi:hypothetical protein
VRDDRALEALVHQRLAHRASWRRRSPGGLGRVPTSTHSTTSRPLRCTRRSYAAPPGRGDTKDTYADTLSLHVIPFLGGCRLAEMDRTVARNYFTALRSEGGRRTRSARPRCYDTDERELEVAVATEKRAAELIGGAVGGLDPVTRATRTIEERPQRRPRSTRPDRSRRAYGRHATPTPHAAERDRINRRPGGRQALRAGAGAACLLDPHLVGQGAVDRGCLVVPGPG